MRVMERCKANKHVLLVCGYLVIIYDYCAPMTSPFSRCSYTAIILYSCSLLLGVPSSSRFVSLSHRLSLIFLDTTPCMRRIWISSSRAARYQH